jgi:hypothetical protein
VRGPAQAAILLVFLLPLSACDLFQTREPEQPSQTTSTFIPPTSYDLVLRNLQFAVSEYNVDNYMRCFVDSAYRRYEFIPAPEARARFANIFNTWSLESERRYFQNLGAPSIGAPSLTFPSQAPIYTGSDSVIYNLNYTLYFPHRKAGIPQVVQGNMQLYLGVDPRRLWSIYRWQDSRTTTDSTWSYWKAVFSGS